MIDGTYGIRVQTGPNDYEEMQLVLTSDSGVLNGAISEIFYRPIPLTNGSIDGDSFSFDIECITIFDDLKLKVQGKVEGVSVFGTFTIVLGKMPFKMPFQGV